MQQILGLRPIWSEMQIGEQDLVLAQLLALDCERFLDLHDQLSLAEDGVGVGGDHGAGRLVVAIRQTGACARAGLDHDLMTFFGELADRRWHDADAEFVVLGFLRHSHQHCKSPDPVGVCICADLNAAARAAARLVWPSGKHPIADFCAKTEFLRQVTSLIMPTRVGWFGPTNQSTCTGI
jgi:hypothetical protein